ncbi:MAG TPA: glycine dehydrogenase (aminomethyl-transferring), partial [Flavobacteriaceae bacterium]|nr:glycine dehydrogenase (aminomethyl-transferring) [Flavobacteriaceae bacterium]
MYAVYHGPEGLKHIAKKVHHAAVALSEGLKALGYELTNDMFFDTVAVKADMTKVKAISEQKNINFYYPEEKLVSISLNETINVKDLNNILSVFSELKGLDPIVLSEIKEGNAIPKDVARKTEFLQQEVFNRYHSETELMRYIKKLERKDLALNHSMISLGSCTMKLNAAAEMLPLSDPNWGNIHPFAPLYQAEGYQIMLRNLENQLTEITGFAGTSLQPNSGAQGEYAGLMVIRAYHESRGDHNRTICLIPSSAHGTNPASAVMAGMQVVVTKATEDGNIDVDDLRQKAEEHK